ncbi:hypothetical protein M0802_015635 [Mischocyttarus mexicanus]|nr:hypothetical protein M0802_015635 [Mischocyttarus mexicanus]
MHYRIAYARRIQALLQSSLAWYWVMLMVFATANSAYNFNITTTTTTTTNINYISANAVVPFAVDVLVV